MIEISTFWFKTLILACFWLGGAFTLIFLAYTKDPDQVLELFRYYWESSGSAVSRPKRLILTLCFWLFYPVLVILGWIGTRKDEAKAKKNGEGEIECLITKPPARAGGFLIFKFYI